jgi:hypothetical protein
MNADTDVQGISSNTSIRTISTMRLSAACELNRNAHTAYELMLTLAKARRSQPLRKPAKLHANPLDRRLCNRRDSV